MASYHCSIKHGTKGTGKAHADYILREGKYTEKKGLEQLVHKASGNLPNWATSANDFFALADEHELSGGRAYSEFEIALPAELTHEQNIALVQAFVSEYVGEKKAYAFAIHDKPAANNPEKRQIHAHIMFTERANDGLERTPKQFFSRANTKHPERGGAKKDDRFTAKNGIGPENVLKVRKAWEIYQNRALKEHGHGARVTAASLETQRRQALERGDEEAYRRLDRPAQVHLGPKLTRMEQRARKEWQKNPEKNRSPFLTEKARINFIVGQHMKFQEQLVQYRQENERTDRHLAKNNQTIAALKEQTAQGEIGAPELITLLNRHVELIEKQLSQQRASRIAVARQSLTEKRMQSIAQSVYSKGQSKALTKEYNAIKRAEKTLQAAKNAYTLLSPKEQEAEAKRLQAWETDLSNRREKNSAAVAALKERFNTPEAKEKIQSMMAAIQKRNQLYHVQTEYLKGQEQELRLQRRTLLQLKNTVVRAGANERYVIAPADLALARANANASGRQAQASVGQIQQAIHGLTVAQPHGGLKAKLAKEHTKEGVERE